MALLGEEEKLLKKIEEKKKKEEEEKKKHEEKMLQMKKLQSAFDVNFFFLLSEHNCNQFFSGKHYLQFILSLTKIEPKDQNGEL